MIFRFGVLALWGLAGFGLFLGIYNRLMHRLRDSPAKLPIVALVLVLFTFGPVSLALARPLWPSAAIPVALLALMALGEIRRLAIRRAYQAAGPVGSISHRIRLTRPVTTTDLVTYRYEISLARWTGPAFRIAHLSDFHLTRRLPPEYYRGVIAAVEEMDPDLVFLTGDYVARRECLPLLMEILRPLGQGRTYAVMGNHDYWTDPDAVASALWRSGVTVLRNDDRTITIGDQSLTVFGYDYPWGTRQKKVVLPSSAGLLLVLSHTPDNVYRVQRAGADAMFSGHCHGGQMRVPVLGALVVPSVYGRRFDHGHFVVYGLHLFVAGGVGAATPPWRIYCPPDLFVIKVMGRKGLDAASHARIT